MSSNFFGMLLRFLQNSHGLCLFLQTPWFGDLIIVMAELEVFGKALRVRYYFARAAIGRSAI